MKRILLLLIAFAAAAFAGWYYWNFFQRISSAPVSTLLPRETIFLAHMPDFNRTLDEWYRSDIYQLYSEATVQDFLRPALGRLANIPKTNAASQTLREIEQLDPKHAFFALSPVNNNSPKFVGGFRFRGSQQEAEAIINRWRSTFLAQNPSAKREKLQYQQHEIELVTSAAFTLATTYDGPWFFAATDVTELKELLDRAEHRAKDPEAMLEKMRCITGSMRFDNGKIHDVLFLGMPKLERGATLTRSSLSLGTKETFFYLSMLLNVGEKIDTLYQVAAFGGNKVLQSLADNGITADDWKAAFGTELGSLADWPSNAHWPSLLLTLPIMDAAKAETIVDALIRGDEGANWTRTEKDGIRYISKQSASSLVAITPTVGLSKRILLAGLDAFSVEEAMKRSATSSAELAESKTYKAAEQLVPTPTNFFAYIDTALLYSRLDASLRPMLLMATAFIPSVASSIDPTKLPSPEIITKHLSPIVSSQRYDHDGYVAESIGPITLDQSAIGVAILSSLGAATLQKTGAGVLGWNASPTAAPQVTSSPSPTP